MTPTPGDILDSWNPWSLEKLWRHAATGSDRHGQDDLCDDNRDIGALEDATFNEIIAKMEIHSRKLTVRTWQEAKAPGKETLLVSGRVDHEWKLVQKNYFYQWKHQFEWIDEFIKVCCFSKKSLCWYHVHIRYIPYRFPTMKIVLITQRQGCL